MKRPVFHASLLKTILVCLAIAGCSTQPSHELGMPTGSALSAQEVVTKNSLLEVYQVWKGAPYRLGGTTVSGVDCSAFVQTTYKVALGMQLPRTTKDQVKLGKAIDYSEASVGDLVFFKTAPKVRHVGVYIGNKQFMHASTSKGVIISRLDNPYWASKYWHFRRVAYSPEIN